MPHEDGCTLKLHGVPGEYVPQAWMRTRPFVNKLLPYTMGEINEELLFKDLCKGHKQLWHVAEGDELIGIWITEIYVERTGLKVINWYGCAGERLDEWLFLKEGIEKWAVEQGATAARITGRKGWERMLPDYSPAFVGYVKELRDEQGFEEQNSNPDHH